MADARLQVLGALFHEAVRAIERHGVHLRQSYARLGKKALRLASREWLGLLAYRLTGRLAPSSVTGTGRINGESESTRTSGCSATGAGATAGEAPAQPASSAASVITPKALINPSSLGTEA